MFLSSATASFSLDSRVPKNSQTRTMKLHLPVVEQLEAEETTEEVKPEPQSQEKHSLLGATTERAETIVDLRSVEEHSPEAMEAKEINDEVEHGEEEPPLSDAVMDEGKPNPESGDERLLADAAMEQPEGVKDQIKPGLRNEVERSLSDTTIKQSEAVKNEVKAEPRSEHPASDTSMERAAMKGAVKPEPQSRENRSLLDEEELGWEDESPKSRKARGKAAARNTRGRNPKVMRRNRSRRVDPIGQVAEVMSCLPLEGVQGGLQLTVNVNITNIHGNFHAAGASTAPNVNNISITNTNSSNPRTFPQEGSEADSDESMSIFLAEASTGD